MNGRVLDMDDIGAVLRPDVRLTRSLLAELFGVYHGAITANIKAIIRSGVVRPDYGGTLVQVGNTVLPEHYDMEMVIALAFRLDSPTAERIRWYILQNVATGTGKPAMPIFINYGIESVVN